MLIYSDYLINNMLMKMTRESEDLMTLTTHTVYYKSVVEIQLTGAMIASHVVNNNNSF